MSIQSRQRQAPRGDKPAARVRKSVEPYKPAPFNVFNHAVAATAQLEQNPADNPGRHKRGGKIIGKPARTRKFLMDSHKKCYADGHPVEVSQ